MYFDFLYFKSSGFSGRLENKNSLSDLLLVETFLTSPMKPQKRIMELDRKQVLKRPLQSLCIWDRLKNKDNYTGLWFTETFSTSPLQSLNRILMELDIQIKPVINILYQVCVFRVNPSSKMASLVAYWLRHFYARAMKWPGHIVLPLSVLPSFRPSGISFRSLSLSHMEIFKWNLAHSFVTRIRRLSSNLGPVE